MRDVLRSWRVPAALVLAVAAGLLAFEAHALASAQAANERDATRSLLVVSGQQPRGSAAQIGTREQSLLGLDGTAALRGALDSIAAGQGAKSRVAGERAKQEAERILSGVVRSDAPADVRSHAANLLGVLVLRDSLSSQRPNGVVAAARLFRRAIELAPENESAKFNLELVLSLPSSRGGSRHPTTAGEGAGVGSSKAGSGY